MRTHRILSTASLVAPALALALAGTAQVHAQSDQSGVRTSEGLIKIPANTQGHSRTPYRGSRSGGGGGAGIHSGGSGGGSGSGAGGAGAPLVDDAGWFIEQDTPGWTATTLTDGRLELVDTRNGRAIIVPSRTELYHGGRLRDGVAQPTLELIERENGCDLVFTFRNGTARPQPLGRFNLGVIALDEVIKTQNFNQTGGPMERDWSRDRGRLFKNYPGNWYSPVFIVRDQDYAVGVSLLYPMLDYEHDVLLSFSPTDAPVEGEPDPVRGWAVGAALGNDGRENDFLRVHYENALQPGETRTYTVTIRVTDQPDQWVRTLTPYRNYFRNLYGSVRYERNTDAIRGAPMAGANRVSPTNPYGWHTERKRPDRNGWGPWVGELSAPTGWPSVMLWKPAGQYGVPNGIAEPTLLALQWVKDAALVGAFNADTGFPVIAQSGKNLGLWWGHAASRVREGGRGHELAPMRAHNPDDVGLLLAEVHLAEKAGASTIGLDSWHHYFAPTWDLYWMLRMMQSEHPNIRFSIEPRGCDVLHTLAPVFQRGWLENATPESMEDLYTLKTPHYLADFLLPGHETWGAMRYQPLQVFFGRPPTPAEVHADATRYADLGFTPCMITPYTMDLASVPQVRATWEHTVPEDLRSTAGPTSETYTYQQLPADMQAVLDLARGQRDKELRNALVKGGFIDTEQASSTAGPVTTHAP